MQIYKKLDIGTAKPDKEELSQAKHHMVDIVEPNEEFSVQEFVSLADKKIEELSKMVDSTRHMQDKLAQYERMEGTLNRAIMMAQKTSDQIKSTAHRESEIILNDAKTNASQMNIYNFFTGGFAVKVEL